MVERRPVPALAAYYPPLVSHYLTSIGNGNIRRGGKLVTIIHHDDEVVAFTAFIAGAVPRPSSRHMDTYM